MPLLNQAKGPLPLSVKFQVPSDAPACFILAGSVWSQQVNQMIGVQLQLDGKVIGSAVIWSNGVATHRAVVPGYIPVTLTYGAHAVEIIALNSAAISDCNDVFDVALDY